MDRTGLAWMDSISASVRATEGYLRPRTAYLPADLREKRRFEGHSDLQYSLNATKTALQRLIPASFRPLENEMQDAEVRLRVLEAKRHEEVVHFR